MVTFDDIWWFFVTTNQFREARPSLARRYLISENVFISGWPLSAEYFHQTLFLHNCPFSVWLFYKDFILDTLQGMDDGRIPHIQLIGVYSLRNVSWSELPVYQHEQVIRLL